LLAIQFPLVRDTVRVNEDGRYRKCFVEAWQKWKGDAANQALVCPMWEKVGSEGDPRTDVCWRTPALPKIRSTSARVSPSTRGTAGNEPAACEGPMPKPHKPGKQSFRYRVFFNQGGAGAACGTAAECAVKCVAGLAKVKTDVDGNILSDPGWWLDPTNYAEYGIPSPYRYPDYYHQMFEVGESFGHRNREGDACSLWDYYWGREDLGMLRGGFCSPYGCLTCCRP
jgi:hypothetical protein